MDVSDRRLGSPPYSIRIVCSAYRKLICGIAEGVEDSPGHSRHRRHFPAVFLALEPTLNMTICTKAWSSVDTDSGRIETSASSVYHGTPSRKCIVRRLARSRCCDNA